jgi:hypothetical protein
MKNRFCNSSSNIKKANIQIKNKIKPQRYIYNLIFTKKISNIKNKRYNRKMDISNNINNNYIRKIIIKNINKYNITANQINLNIINNFINDKSTHNKAFLKDYNIFNDYSEYLKGFYRHKEIIKIFPKFYTYYKNYFEFFLKPTLSDFYFCNMLKKSGNQQAEYFYEKYKDKKNMIKNKDKKNNYYNKKILKTNIIEKSSNYSSLNFSNEINNQKNIRNSDFSSISLLSMINLISKNTSLNKLDKENDFMKKKINLFLDLKKGKNTNNKSQKSTTILTPTNLHNVKIINSYKDYKSTKPKIKNDIKINSKNIFKKNNENNGIICLSERASIENNFRNNYKNLLTNIKKKSNYKNSDIKASLNTKTNSNNIVYYNMKESSFIPTNTNVYKLTTQMSHNKLDNSSTTNYTNLLSQTQINKVIKKSPTFRDNVIMKNNIDKIKSKNIKYNIFNNSNEHNNMKKLFFRNRNNFSSNSFIYYQKIKSENNVK